jgi:Methyltransferase small domain
LRAHRGRGNQRALVAKLEGQRQKTIYANENNFRVVCSDFLECNGDLGKFDRVLMNPPFANGSDIKHIKHALTFLKPGGRLVAICAGGTRQAEALQPLAEDSGGLWEPLPADTFKESGTAVNTVLLTINQERELQTLQAVPMSLFPEESQ